MMLNTLTMTDEQARDARSKAFFLLKKWTSVTFLRNAVDLYRDFLSAYARQLDAPSPNQQELENAYVTDFLPALARMDDGIEILSKGGDKRSAYGLLIAGSEKGGELLFGRSAHEIGRTYDPFFHALGLRDSRYSDFDYAAGYAEGAWIEELSCKALNCTIGLDFSEYLSYGKRADGGRRIFRHWTYESLFQDHVFPAWRYWPPGRSYPANLDACPPKNESSAGEVSSGEEIPVEGIWEPWFPGDEVGCPSYFLKGSVAHTYLLEGTNDEYAVRWRLLWEDTRYRDGSIPEEESTYFPQPVAQTSLRALPGETCPRTGRWHSPAVKESVHVEAGEPMPGPQRTPWGMVIWHYADPQP
ncbi:Imm72 family immunity protein [Burkholderia gladioli]|uniref:Imm72 family immunity protein n=1 Tax=Burkholderia gladioli TaxID=28095 RepID=UPI000D007EB9|nr:Imm72 family immunity protein [Burkholderia gladioli]PRH13335.1 hypothetical protein C6V08_01800 [Burkholderia gladioli]